MEKVCMPADASEIYKIITSLKDCSSAGPHILESQAAVAASEFQSYLRLLVATKKNLRPFLVFFA